MFGQTVIILDKKPFKPIHYMMNTVLIFKTFKTTFFQNGLYSSFPFIGFWAVITASGIIADKLRSQHILSTVRTRKLFDFIGTINSGFMQYFVMPNQL